MLYTSVILSNMVIAQRMGTDMTYMNVAKLQQPAIRNILFLKALQMENYIKNVLKMTWAALLQIYCVRIIIERLKK